MKTVWPVLGSGKENDLPLIVTPGDHEVDHGFITPVVLPGLQGGQGVKKPEGEDGSIRASEGEKTSGEVFGGGDEDVAPVPHDGADGDRIVTPDLVLERQVLSWERLEVEMIRCRGTTARAVVDKAKMRREFASQRYGIGETRSDGLGAMMLMADDDVLIKNRGDVAQNQILVSDRDAPFFRMETRGAQKAGAFLNGDRVNSGGNALHTVGRVLTDDPAVVELEAPAFRFQHRLMTASKPGPHVLLLLVECLDTRHQTIISVPDQVRRKVSLSDDSPPFHPSGPFPVSKLTCQDLQCS